MLSVNFTFRIGHGSADAWKMLEPICVTTLLRKHLFLTLKKFNPPEEVSYVFLAHFRQHKKTTSNRKGPKEQNRGRRNLQEKGAAEERQEGTQSGKHESSVPNPQGRVRCSQVAFVRRGAGHDCILQSASAALAIST